MRQRILTAIKHFALSAAVRGLPQRRRQAAFEAPEPLKQPSLLPKVELDDDGWMFDRRAPNAISHRMELLSNEMERLSGALTGLRAFLGSISDEAPLIADYNVSSVTAPMITDTDLFDGEPLAIPSSSIPAVGDATFLFADEKSLVSGSFVEAELIARAA